MRYLIVSAQYLPHTGGVETFTARLAEQLRAEGDDVRILTSAVEGEPERSVQPNGVEVLRVPTHQLMGGRLPMLVHGRRTSSMVRELRAQGADRVLVNTRFYDLSFVGVSLANKIGAPCVVLDHGSDYLTLNNGLADAAIRAFEHVQTRALMGRRPRFAGISDMSACWLERFGIHTSAVIPNAIDARAFRELSSGRDYRSELGLDPSQPIVAFVGRLMAEKGALRWRLRLSFLRPKACKSLWRARGPTHTRSSAWAIAACTFWASSISPISPPSMRRARCFVCPRARRASARRCLRLELGASRPLSRGWGAHLRCWVTPLSLAWSSLGARPSRWRRDCARRFRWHRTTM